MELLGNLGINTKLFIAQLVNFAILFFVLKKFVYQPLLQVLEERKKKIEKGIKSAEQAERKLAEISEKEKKILEKAQEKAQKILLEAERKAEENRRLATEETTTEINKMMKKADEEIEKKKEQMLTDLKKDLAQLVVSATEKVLVQKIDEKSDEKIIDKAIAEIK